MFDTFSEEARVWVYGFRHELSDGDQDKVRHYLDLFTSDWKSHHEEVAGAYAILHNRFVILIAESKVSGCSIDGSVRIFKELKQRYDLDALDQSLIYFLLDDCVNCSDRPGFRELLKMGRIKDDTPVFDLTVADLGAFRKAWIVPFSRSWQARAFRKSA